MPLKVKRRKDTGALIFSGTVAGRRIRESAGTDVRKTAEGLCALREAELLRGHFLGERATRVAFEQAVLAYLADQPRMQRTKDNLHRLLPQRPQACPPLRPQYPLATERPVAGLTPLWRQPRRNIRYTGLFVSSTCG